jgi:hypothetical protein
VTLVIHLALALSFSGQRGEGGGKKKKRKRNKKKKKKKKEDDGKEMGKGTH